MSDRDLRLDVILSAIDKATGPIKAIAGGSQKMAAVLKAARAELQGFEREGRKLEEFRKGADAIQANADALTQARARLRDMQAQIVAAEHPHRDLTDAYKAQRKEVLALERTGARLTSNQAELRRQIESGGVSVDRLASRQAELRRQMAQANSTIQAQAALMAKLRTAQHRYQETMALRDKALKFGTGAVATGAALGAPLVNAVREYATFEDALLGVQRQVGEVGEVGSLAYKRIAAEIRLLGRELPIPTNQIADMYTAAARMEVPRNELAAFTRTVTMMATAFDAVPDEIAEAMGKVAKNFRIPVTEIRGLADVINYLDDQSISKSAEIIDVLNRTSGVASSVALTERATAALASTLLSLGDRAEPAATAMNAIVQKFAAAEKGTKGFREAMGELGLSLTEIQGGMQKDAQGTLMRVIEAIQRLPAHARTGVMVDLVGMEHADTMAKLVTNTAEWRRQIELANSAAADGSMEREFQKRTAALTGHWERFKNSLFDVNTRTGEALRGELIDLMQTVGGLLNGISDWMAANPELAATLVKVAAVTALVVTGLGALALAMAAVIGPFAVLRYGLALFAAIGLKAVLIGGLIVGAVVAIGAAAYLIYKNWEPIKAWFAGLWDEIKAAFGDGLLGVSALILNWSPLGLFYKAIASLLGYFGIELPGKFTEFGGMLLDGLVRGITGALGKAKDAITNAGGAVVGWFKEKLGIRSPSRVFAELGGFTMEGLALGLQGGAAAPLKALGNTARTLVAAAGAGLAGMGVAMAGGAGITIDTRPPMTAPAAAGAAGGNHYEIHIHAAPGMDPQAIGRAVAAELDRRDREAAARRRSRLADDE